MVRRRLLTTDFVNSISPPAQGECWVADTKLRGFGLRLWKTTRGEGKAFAIRAIDSTGRQIRQTFDGKVRSLGNIVDNAREWAIDELCRINGRPTLLEEEDEHRRRIDERISKLTLDDLVKAMLRGMEIRGLTEQYRDTLNKLYHKHLPLKIQQTKISKIRPRALAKIYRSLGETPGAAVKLRAFLGQIIKDVEFHSRPLLRAFYLARQLSGAQFHIPRRTFSSFEQSSRLPEELFDKLFESLDRNKSGWLQATWVQAASKCELESRNLKALIRSYHWSVVFPRRRLAYHTKHYGNFVQGTEPRQE